MDDEQNILLALKRELHQWARDKGFEILMANSGKEGLARLDEFGPLIELIISDLRMPEMKGSDFSPSPDVHDWYFQRIAQYGYVDDFEIVLKNKDGMHVFCSETAHVLKDDEGQILEIQGSIKDISDRIEHQQELWKMNMELVQSGK